MLQVVIVLSSLRLLQKNLGLSAAFRSIFPYSLEITQPGFTRKDVVPDGTLRVLSRIDRAFMNIPYIPMAEARDFLLPLPRDW